MVIRPALLYSSPLYLSKEAAYASFGITYHEQLHQTLRHHPANGFDPQRREQLTHHLYRRIIVTLTIFNTIDSTLSTFEHIATTTHMYVAPTRHCFS